MRGTSASEDDRTILSSLGVEEAVADGYGLVVTAQRRLGGEVDQNVWIRTSTGDEFLVKVSTDAGEGTLRWQETVLLRLEQQAPEIPVSRLVRTTTGDAMLSRTESGRTLVVRLLTWMPGTMLAELPHLPGYLLFELGTVAARLTQALVALPYDSFQGSHHWDIRNAHEAVADALPFVEDEADRRAVEELMGRFERVRPQLSQLPSGVVHHDLNDFNVLARWNEQDRLVISGVIDVNDSMFTVRVAELAIAVGYAMLRQADPLRAAASVVAGFNSVAPLTEAEVAVVFPLAAARLCVNATTWTRRTSENHHPYGRERMRHTWPMLHKLASITASSAEQRLRSVCGFSTTTGGVTSEGLTVSSDELMPVFADQGVLTEVDLGPSGDFFDDRSWSDPEQVAAALAELRRDRTGRRGFTRHLSVSMLRTGRRLSTPPGPATVQVGVRLLALEQEQVHTPLAGVVVRADAEVLTLRHSGFGSASDADMHICWRGLDPSVEPGASVRAGEPIGRVRKPTL
ncbi:MAG: phosphotransferase, partial [Nocardioides sp.]